MVEKPKKVKMRPMQYELMNDYLREINSAEDRREKLYEIIKKEKRTWFNVVDTVFLILIFGGVIWGIMNGAYVHNTVIIDQQGQILSINGQPNTQNKTINDYGLKKVGILAENLTIENFT